MLNIIFNLLILAVALALADIIKDKLVALVVAIKAKLV